METHALSLQTSSCSVIIISSRRCERKKMGGAMEDKKQV